MSVWELRCSSRWRAILFAIICGVTMVISEFPLQAADLPSAAKIQTAYRENFAKFMPLQVEYHVTIADHPAAIEADRQHIKQMQLLATADPVLTSIDGNPVDEAQLKAMVAYTTEQLSDLKTALTDEAVENRLKGWKAGRLSVWTDGESFHLRSARNPADPNVTLFPGAVTPPENLTTLYESITVASWSKSNSPPLRCWFGGSAPGQGRIANALNDCTSVTGFVPLGFVKNEWTHKSDWHEIDRLMAADPSRLHVVDQTEVNGRMLLVVEAASESGERIRAWIDPEQGYLPLRMEWSYVDKSNGAARPPHRELRILSVKSIAGGYYPVRMTRRELIPDPTVAEKQRQEHAAGTLAKDTPHPPLVPSRTTTWEVTHVSPKKAIEPAALALEFPPGALYSNALDDKIYHVGDPQPLPSPRPPIRPTEVAPPLEVAAWTDGRSRDLAALEGEVVVLIFSEKLPADPKRPLDNVGNELVNRLHAKFAPQGVVFLEIFAPGSDIAIVRQATKTRRGDYFAGIDKLLGPQAGATSQKYVAGGDSQFVVIGRDGRVVFNVAAVEEREGMRLFFEAARALSIPWPLDESGPEEEVNRQMQKIFEYVIGKPIEQALAQP